MTVSRITRRQALGRLSAGALLAMGLWPGALRARDTGRGGSFKFIVVNDTHLMTDQCAQWLEGVAKQMNAEAPELCLHAGDLTEHGRREHLAAAREVFQGIDCPVYPVIGNHDYNSPESCRYYRFWFPRRVNYWFEHRGWQFIGLDTSEGQKYEKTRIQKATFDWVDAKRSKLDPQRPTVIFTHFPLGPGVRYRPLNADDLLERFKSFNVQRIFCGHFHGFTQKPVLNTIAYTNRCCALKRNNHDKTREKGFFVCETRDGQIAVRFVQVPVPPNPA